MWTVPSKARFFGPDGVAGADDVDGLQGFVEGALSIGEKCKFEWWLQIQSLDGVHAVFVNVSTAMDVGIVRVVVEGVTGRK